MIAFFYLGDDNGDQTQFYLIIAGIVIITFFLLRRAVMHNKKGRDNDRPRPGKGQRQSSLQSSLKGDTEKLLVELQEFGREIEGRLETRIQHLTRLLAEADKAVERLNAAVAAARNETPRGDASGNGNGEEAQDGEKGPLKEHIMALSDQGLAPSEIAEAVGKPLGEVELFLGLGRRINEESRKKRETNS